MLHALIREPVGQTGGDVTRAIVGKQPWTLHHPGIVAAGSL